MNTFTCTKVRSALSRLQQQQDSTVLFNFCAHPSMIFYNYQHADKHTVSDRRNLWGIFFFCCLLHCQSIHSCSYLSANTEHHKDLAIFMWTIHGSGVSAFLDLVSFILQIIAAKKEVGRSAIGCHPSSSIYELFFFFLFFSSFYSSLYIVFSGQHSRPIDSRCGGESYWKGSLKDSKSTYCLHGHNF